MTNSLEIGAKLPDPKSETIRENGGGGKEKGAAGLQKESGFFGQLVCPVLGELGAWNCSGVSFYTRKTNWLRNRAGLFVANWENNWQEDVIERDMLSDGRRTTIRFAPGETTRFWDLRVDLENGDLPQWVQTCLTQDGRCATLFQGRRGDCRNTLDGMTVEAGSQRPLAYRRTAEDARPDKGQTSWSKFIVKRARID